MFSEKLIRENIQGKEVATFYFEDDQAVIYFNDRSKLRLFLVDEMVAAQYIPPSKGSILDKTPIEIWNLIIEKAKELIK